MDSLKSHLNKVGQWVESTIMKSTTTKFAAALIKHVDSKGRLNLGEAFANETVLVEPHGDGEVIVRRARVIPAREAWLYDNKAALASVRRGLQQAAEHHFVAGPDFAADAELAGQLQDE
jgi:hypothetical protein